MLNKDDVFNEKLKGLIYDSIPSNNHLDKEKLTKLFIILSDDRIFIKKNKNFSIEDIQEKIIRLCENNEVLEYFYYFIKLSFFNSEKGRWQIFKTITTLKMNKIDKHTFVYILDAISNESFIKVKSLENYIKKIDEQKYGSDWKLEMIKKNDLDLLHELKNLKIKYIKGSNEEFIDFITNNFNFTYSRDTLRKYFYIS
ncbi:hypothetical protein ACXGQW_05525 [Wenyingzhuangia sp. IMCC45533]